MAHRRHRKAYGVAAATSGKARRRQASGVAWRKWRINNDNGVWHEKSKYIIVA